MKSRAATIRAPRARLTVLLAQFEYADGFMKPAGIKQINKMIDQEIATAKVTLPLPRKSMPSVEAMAEEMELLQLLLMLEEQKRTTVSPEIKALVPFVMSESTILIFQQP